MREFVRPQPFGGWTRYCFQLPSFPSPGPPQAPQRRPLNVCHSFQPRLHNHSTAHLLDHRWVQHLGAYHLQQPSHTLSNNTNVHRCSTHLLDHRGGQHLGALHVEADNLGVALLHKVKHHLHECVSGSNRYVIGMRVTRTKSTGSASPQSQTPPAVGTSKDFRLQPSTDAVGKREGTARGQRFSTRSSTYKKTAQTHLHPAHAREAQPVPNTAHLVRLTLNLPFFCGSTRAFTLSNSPVWYSCLMSSESSCRVHAKPARTRVNLTASLAADSWQRGSLPLACQGGRGPPSAACAASHAGMPAAWNTLRRGMQPCPTPAQSPTLLRCASINKQAPSRMQCPVRHNT